MGLEGCVKAAKEYLKVAQSHVEQFARFVESWESAQKQSAGSQHSNGHTTSTPQTDDATTTGGSPQSSHDSSTIVGRSDAPDPDSQADRIEEVNQILSDVSNNTHIFKDQHLVSPTSTRSPKRDKIVLGAKDQNRPLRPKSDLVMKTTQRSSKEDLQNFVRRNRRSRLRGENEPWSALAPQETTQPPQRSQHSRPKRPSDDGNADADSASEHALSWSTQHSPSTPSQHRNLPRYRVEETSLEFVETERLDSFSAKFGETCPSMHLPLTTTPLGETTDHQLQGNLFEDFQFPTSNDDVESYDNIMDAEFNLDFDYNQEMIQGLDDPFVSPLMTSHTSTPSELMLSFNQDPLAYLPTEETAFRTPYQGPIFNSNMNNGSVSSNTYFRTPSSSLRTPSLGSTPSSSMSQGAAPITPRDLVCTPTRKPSGQWQRGGSFGNQDKALGYVNNWPLEGLDSVM